MKAQIQHTVSSEEQLASEDVMETKNTNKHLRSLNYFSLSSSRIGRCYIASLTLSVAVKFRIFETEPNLLARVYLYLPNKLDAGHRRIRPRYNITSLSQA